MNISANNKMFEYSRICEHVCWGKGQEAFAIRNVEIGWDINLGECIRVKENLMGGRKEGMCMPMVDTKTGNVDMA